MNREQKLIDELKKRKKGSLEKVIDLYTPYVNVIAYNVIGSIMQKEDIEEVVSDVFISLWKNAEVLDSEKGKLRSYLGTTARNCAKNKLRTYRTHEEIIENISSNDKTPEIFIEAEEEKETLVSLIMLLGEPDSEIFIRFYYYDESIGKISKITGICVSTVKSKLARGRKKLKEIIEKKGRYIYE